MWWYVSGLVHLLSIIVTLQTSSIVTPGLGYDNIGCSFTEGTNLNISSPPLYHLTLYTCSPFRWKCALVNIEMCMMSTTWGSKWHPRLVTSPAMINGATVTSFKMRLCDEWRTVKMKTSLMGSIMKLRGYWLGTMMMMWGGHGWTDIITVWAWSRASAHCAASSCPTTSLPPHGNRLENILNMFIWFQ